jgi:HEAT repeat protein
MKKLVLVSAVLALAAALLPVAGRAQAGEEQQLIDVLRSEATVQEKGAACAQLKRVGTELCIPALAELLPNEELSHAARYALESLPGPQAEGALVAALAKTSGLTQAGIINSLANRARMKTAGAAKLSSIAKTGLIFEDDAAEVPALEKLLAGAEPEAARAAAAALGEIGVEKSVLAALARARSGTNVPAREMELALEDGALRCANTLLAFGDKRDALDIFQKLHQTQTKEFVQVAAYRGMILSSPDKAAESLILKALAGKTGPSQVAALQVVHDAKVPVEVQAMARLLAKANPPLQVALMGALAQRGDTAAAKSIAKLAVSPVPEVRLAALKALGLLGDATAVPVLVEAAAGAADADSRGAARQSLTLLRRGAVTDALLARLGSTNSLAQAEAARALGERGDASAFASLLETAQQNADPLRKSALQALAQLADAGQLSALVKLVTVAKNSEDRNEAAEALNTACQRLQSRRGHLDAAPLLAGLAEGSVEAQATLLPVCSGLTGPQTRGALRAAVADPNMRIRAAGIRALCDSGDAELLPDLTTVACEAPEENLRTLAIAACLRLTNPEEGSRISSSNRLEMFKMILKTALNAEQDRLVLAGLSAIPDAAVLDLIEPLLRNPEVRAEAAQAALKVATLLPVAQATEAEAALKKIVETVPESPVRREAAAALKRVEGHADFITAWQAAGPYVAEGKECKDLLDIAFPPEDGDAAKVEWQNLPANSDPKRPWVMDLLKVFEGEERAAYARTWIHSDAAQAASLEIGSDDGVKVWLNHKLVHANNVIRGLKPGSDKVSVHLDSGWNELLLKVTQHNQGWEFCARLRKPDGSRLEGLEVDSTGEKAHPPQNN